MAIQGAMSWPVFSHARRWKAVKSICLRWEWAWTMREGAVRATVLTGCLGNTIRLSSTTVQDSALLIRLLRWFFIIGNQKSSTVIRGCAIDLLGVLEFWGRGRRLWVRIAVWRWRAAGGWWGPVAPHHLSGANKKAHLGPLLWLWDACGVDGLMRSRGRSGGGTVSQTGGGFVHSADVAAAGLWPTVILLRGTVAIDVRVILQNKQNQNVSDAVAPTAVPNHKNRE